MIQDSAWHRSTYSTLKLILIGCHFSWLLAKPSNLATTFLWNWTFQERLVSCPGLESLFTFYNSLLLSWWEVCCITFLEKPVSYPFGHLFSKMLPYLPYLGERPLYFIILMRGLLLSPLRCLFLWMPSCLSYLRQSHFCHLLSSHSFVICSPQMWL
jgi:hypothetical protein